ncbi:hypothetical protein [Phytopseudomonas dryadis]|uniref:hypothetical protein n=1 Tax=Pseudomonadaceae TaxID=135621 RepID=UPI001037512B|nr:MULTISPECIES: hypothetical protein [Pseudomonas]
MKKKLHHVSGKVAAVAVLASLSLGADADDIGFGIGVSYVFGEGPALGVKAFSSDEEKRGALSLGLDYVFSKQSLRPNVGVAYQGSDYFGDANVGYTMKTQSVNFALGAGWSNAKEDRDSTVFVQQPAESPPAGGGGNLN